MRSFVGIPCEETVHPELSDLRDSLDFSSIKPVRTENFHLTVKFLGDITNDQLVDIDSLFQRRLPPTGPLTLTISGVGVFPNPKNPSVVWAGISTDDPLNEIYESVESVTVDLGFDTSTHEFTPHVTLGRFKEDLGDRQKLLNWMQSNGNAEFGTFTAKNLHLFESKQQKDGPIYNSLVKWPL